MKQQVNKNRFSFWGYILFFCANMTTVTITIYIHDFVRRTSHESNRIISIVMILVIAIISTICTFFDMIRKRVMIDSPVKNILETTGRITSGDFSARANIEHSYEKYDEFDIIMDNLNIMASTLEKSEILKSDFISNVSHEMKTPLSNIQNYCCYMLDDTLDEDTRKKYAETLIHTSQKMTALINNILKLNKLENQEIQPEYTKINLTKMLSDIILDYEKQIDDKNLILKVDMENVFITSSSDYLEIAWRNLLSNAIKFTPNGGTIGVCLKKENDSVSVQITDTGCGISPEI